MCTSVQVAAGQEDASVLRRAEQTLSKMQRRLVSLDADYSAATEEVSGVVAPRSSRPAASSSGSGGNKVRTSWPDRHFGPEMQCMIVSWSCWHSPASPQPT